MGGRSFRPACGRPNPHRPPETCKVRRTDPHHSPGGKQTKFYKVRRLGFRNPHSRLDMAPGSMPMHGCQECATGAFPCVLMRALRGRTGTRPCRTRLHAAGDRNLGSAWPPAVQGNPHRAPGEKETKNCKVRKSYKLGSAWPPAAQRNPHRAPGEKETKNCKVRKSYKLGSAWPPAAQRNPHRAPGEKETKNCKVRKSYKLGSAWPRREYHRDVTRPPAPLRSAVIRLNSLPRLSGASLKWYLLPWHYMEPPFFKHIEA